MQDKSANNAIIYLIILNWNGYVDTCACLDSLRGIAPANLRVVVVDNASTNDSLSHISDWAAAKGIETLQIDRVTAESAAPTRDLQDRIVLIQTGKNLGFAGGNNVGIRYALKMGAECVWLLNNDTVVKPDSVKPLIAALYSEDSIGIVGSCILYYDRPNIVQTAGMKLGPHNLQISHLGQGKAATDISVSRQTEVACVPACSILVRRELMQDIGLMDESYFMYHEDVDWQIRAKRAGWKIVYVPGSKVLHKCGGSTKRSQFVGAYYQSRNKFILISKNEGRLAFLFMVPLGFAFIRNILVAFLSGDHKAAWGIWQGGKDFFFGRSGHREF